MKTISNRTYNFATIRTSDWIYVDKTAWLHRLVTEQGQGFYFISRPRRFGKSLMISTLKCIFEGRKELFDGLAIAKTDYDWKPYVVLHFNFADMNVSSLEAFRKALYFRVFDVVRKAGVAVPENRDTAELVFDYALQELSGKYGRIVVLIDEYDAPIAHALTQKVSQAEEIRFALSQFYVTLKTYEDNIRFLMLTGVTKFNQASVFSALNNIKDLSLEADYADMLGYTEDELTANFDDHMRLHAEKMGLPYEAYRAELKHWYDGYRFSPDTPAHVYNPVAIAATLIGLKPTFGTTWTDTGSTSLLIHLIRREALLKIEPEETVPATKSDLGAVTDLNNLPAPSVLFQTGYLTIVKASQGAQTFDLGLPNEEIRQSYESFYLNQRTRRPNSFWQSAVVGSFEKGDPDTALPLLRDAYASLVYGPGEKVAEANYRRLLMMLFHVGERRAEEPNSAGKRSDLVLTFPNVIYVIEFKNTAADTADSAIAQIKDRGYAKPYLHSGKTVYAMGLAFDPKDRTLKDAKAEKLSSAAD